MPFHVSASWSWRQTSQPALEEGELTRPLQPRTNQTIPQQSVVSSKRSEDNSVCGSAKGQLEFNEIVDARPFQQVTSPAPSQEAAVHVYDQNKWAMLYEQPKKPPPNNTFLGGRHQPSYNGSIPKGNIYYGSAAAPPTTSHTLTDKPAVAASASKTSNASAFESAFPSAPAEYAAGVQRTDSIIGGSSSSSSGRPQQQLATYQANSQLSQRIIQ
jgi:hypothetical protein